MKVVMWMAMSLNGMIAGIDNNEDFISHDSWLEWLKWVKKSGCLVWGRKTYEIVKTWDKRYFEDIKGVRAVIVSKNKDFQVKSGFVLVSSPKEAFEYLSREGFETVVVTGGSENNSSFAKAGLIDEVVLNIEPVLVGQGIPLLKPSDIEQRLKLQDVIKITPQLIQLHYEVLKEI